MQFRILALLMLVLACRPAEASDGARVALVIGNSAYQHTTALANPRNDAEDLGSELKKLGFDVMLELDLDKAAFDRVVRQFSQKLRGSRLGVLFYAGHGLQVDLQNYLVPVDARLTDASALDFEMVRLDLIQRIMERETNTNIIFLDACRDNPLARNLARAMGTRSAGIGRGLAAVESGEGTLIAFSTQPGNVALDGSGRNSPFASALKKYIGAKSEDLFSVLINVRNDVMAATNRRQVPWDHSALTARVYFDPEGPARDAQSFEKQAELALWGAVKDSNDPSIVETYLEKFPTGTFAATARLLVEKLKREIQRNREADAQTEQLRQAEAARAAAEAAKIESERKALLARQSDDLKKAQEEARRAREALAKAEQEREAARKTAEQARKDAEAAKADREATAGKPERTTTSKSGSNCFTFNGKTYCR